MITAVDANISLDILLPNEQFFGAASSAVRLAATGGSLVICDVVYAELSVHFATQQECDDFLEENDARVEALTRASHLAVA